MEKVIIETLRLRLRPIDNKDAVELFKYRSDAVTNKFQGWIPKELEDAYEFIKKTSTEIDIVDSWFQFVIIERNSNELVGDIGVHFLDTDKKQVEIGITLDKNQQGKGFATEALKGTIDFLFNKLNKHRITASIDPENNKSIELFERLGFRKEAHFRESLLINGEWADDLIFAILKNEWK
ncbi:MAG: GNAT family protein [Lutibacter sp.]|uniref:GNAT family N-acetyltransferase n=1 Tax=Lutibacter sp. TaxID=1925666 RepID=UPI00299F406E|nr:GNAT family protein [Lutibacter sp.]MDX1829685.1 GNAT family protein [Lutibacter sp.]